MTAYERRQSRNFSNSSLHNRLPRISDVTITQDLTGASVASESSPMRLDRANVHLEGQASLFEQAMPEEVVGGDISFDELEVEMQLLDQDMSICVQPAYGGTEKLFGTVEKGKIDANVKPRDVFGDKENILPPVLRV